MNPPTLFEAQVDYRQDLTSDTYEIDLITKKPFYFIAGQFVTLKIPRPDGKGFTPRAYSIACLSRDDHTITLCIKKFPNGTASNYLYTVPRGTKIQTLGPTGDFVFKSETIQNVYFICTGTGIAPFISMLEAHLKSYRHIHFHMLFGVSFVNDLIFRDILSVHIRNYKNFSYTLCVSRGKKDPSVFHGRITDKLATMDLKTNGHYYICGNPDMVDDVSTLLKEQSIDDDQIFTEKY